jgi:hypothetical protein
MDVLSGIPQKLDAQNAFAEWGWTIRYGLREMVEEFIKEFKRTI